MINTPGNKIILVDSDALIGLIHQDDSLHKRCLDISGFLTQNSYETIIPYPILLEAATALAKDKTIKRPDLAERLLKDYAKIEAFPQIDMNVAQLVANLYHSKTSRHNSPFDYYLLALAKKNSINQIFSFDSFYKKQGLTLIEDLL